MTLTRPEPGSTANFRIPLFETDKSRNSSLLSESLSVALNCKTTRNLWRHVYLKLFHLNFMIATYVFFTFFYWMNLGTGIDPVMALKTFPSDIGWDTNWTHDLSIESQVCYPCTRPDFRPLSLKSALPRLLDRSLKYSFNLLLLINHGYTWQFWAN